MADFGSIDVLINNAGITQAAKLLDIDPESWDRILDVNLRGVLYLSQAVVPQMKKQKSGSIGCMSSVSAQRGGGILGGPHYSAAKAGVLGLAKAMARELGSDGIRVNCVTPGLIQTDINAGKIPDDKRGEILAGIPAGRLGVPDDVAGAFLFLAADISSYITGAVHRRQRRHADSRLSLQAGLGRFASPARQRSEASKANAPQSGVADRIGMTASARRHKMRRTRRDNHTDTPYWRSTP